jgi:hypothetical protein
MQKKKKKLPNGMNNTPISSQVDIILWNESNHTHHYQRQARQARVGNVKPCLAICN